MLNNKHIWELFLKRVEELEQSKKHKAFVETLAKHEQVFIEACQQAELEFYDRVSKLRT